MTTTKNIIGMIPKGGGGLVGINLTTAGHLVSALERAAADLERAAGVARVAAGAEGLAPAAAARTGLAAVWALGEAATLRSVIARLAALDTSGVGRWRGGDDPAFADPLNAHRLALLVLDALHAGREPEARALLAGHGRDPVLATVLVAGLGVDGIIGLLHPAVEQWARTGGDAAIQRELVLGVADALALALRHGTAEVTVGGLVAEAERRDVPLSALALLFLGPGRFPASFLREAVTSVVLPLNAVVRREPGRGVDPWLIPAVGAPLDARVVILQAAARDHEAAVEAVGAADLDDLLPAAVAYLDGGVALAELLLAATTPLDGAGRPVAEPLTTAGPVHPGREGDNARRVIEWIGEHQEAPLAVQASLGRLARPWIGAFRSAGLDAVVSRPVDIAEAEGRAFLTYAQARDGVDGDLQDAAWTWAAIELDRLAGPGVRGAGFDAVGSVLGVVTVTGLDADAARAVDRDDEVRRHGRLWRRVTHLTVDRLPSPFRPVVDPAVDLVLDRLLARSDDELHHWSTLRDLTVAHEHLALDYLVASTLWARGDDNGLLAPPRRLRGSGSGRTLRHPLSLGATDAEAWTRWRSAQADDGPAPRRMAGDQFLAETRE